MATPIEATPTLYGEDVVRFVERMKEPPEKCVPVDFDKIISDLHKRISPDGTKYL